MRNVSVEVVEPSISDVFVKNQFPPKTIVNIHTRDHRDTTNLIKTFYSKFPQYRWITFRDLRGLSEVEFAEAMKDSFVSIWIDQTSSFGTFPLESMKMGIPVLGLVPDNIPTWMNEDNGLWVNNKTIIVDVLSDFIQNWLEDNLNPELFVNMDNTMESISTLEKFESDTISLFSKMFEVRITSFEDQLSKLETI
jgi:glycosyltransferase involved in cell wall biosynthesis